MNILRRYIYIYTYTRGARVANYNSKPSIHEFAARLVSRARLHAEKKGGEIKRIRDSGKRDES